MLSLRQWTLLARPGVLLALATLSTVLSCSSDSGTTPDPGPVTESSANIQPGGGSVTVENENGVTLRVTLPAGAVLVPTRITLRAVDAPSGVKARFAIDPPGHDFLAPVEFTIKAPDGMAFNERVGLAFTSGEQVLVPGEVDVVERTVKTSLYHLGFDLPTPPSLAAGRALGDEGNEFIDMREFECQLARDQLTDAILRAQAFSGAFPPDLASPLIQQYRAAVLVCDSPDSVAAASAALREYACSNVNSAEAQSQALPVTTAQELKQSLGFLVAAEGLAQEAGADCHVQPGSMEAEFDEFISAYIDRINAPGFTRNFPTWDALWRELITCVEIKALAEEYAVAEASQRVDSEVFPALFARLHEVAQTACNEDDNNSFLLDIVTGGHALDHPLTAASEMPAFTGLPQPAVVDEMLKCGSAVTADARTADNDALDIDVVAAGTTGGVRVIRGGKIVLTSDILAFNCDGFVSRGPYRVRAEVPGHLPVIPLGNLSGSLTVNVSQTLASLPEVENEQPRNFDIVIERDRNVCGIDAPGTIELARISVDTHGFTGSASGTWSGGCPGGPVSGTFVISTDDDGNVTGTFDGSASGFITGTVAANGTFNATANGSAGGCTWQGAMSIAGGTLSGSGSWNCGDAGCSGSYTSN